jgi:tyrosinase
LSPVDPIFWLHHANVDRLWDVWTRRQRAAGLPHLPADAEGERWQNEVHPFFVNGQAQPMGDRRTRDYIDNVALGYTYEPGTGEELVDQSGTAEASAARGTGIRILATQGAVQALRIGQAATRTAAVDNELNAILRGLAPTASGASSSSDSDAMRNAFRESGPPKEAAPGAGAAAAASGRLVSANVGLALPPRSRKLRFDVFLNASNPSGSTSLTDPHFVGSIFAFGMEHMSAGAGAHGGHGAHGAAAATHNMAYSLPLGPTIARLQQAGISVGNNLRILVVPRAVGRVQESSGSAGALANVQIEVI